MILSISYSRYLSTATATAAGMPASGVSTMKPQIVVPSQPLETAGVASRPFKICATTHTAVSTPT